MSLRPLAYSARVAALLLAVAPVVPASPLPQEAAVPFDGPWRGIDTGYAANVPGPAGGFGPEALASGDMDGDGQLDVVLSYSSASAPGVAVMLGLGGGRFGTPDFHSTGSSNTVFDLELHDMDGDGDLDVFAAINGNFGTGNAVGLWRNTGNGSLGPRQNLNVGAGPMEIELADVNGDGLADLVCTTNGFIGNGNTISVRLHNGLVGGAAGFLPPVSSPSVNGPLGLAVTDMNGDGLPDVVVAGSMFRNMGIGLNTGGGSFAAPQQTWSLDFGGSFTSPRILAFDVDGDGDSDVASSSQGKLVIWRNDGQAQLSGAVEHPFASASPLDEGVTLSAANAYRLATADVNGDGFPDLLTANSNGQASESWNLFLNNGRGGLSAPTAHHCSALTHDVEAADVDADGDLDVLTVAHSSAALTVHRNDGTAMFGDLVPVAVEPLSEQLAVGDVDADGDQDIVTIGSAAWILRNDGTGTLVPDAAPFATPIDGKDALLVDLNGDDIPDLVLGPDEDAPPYRLGVMLADGVGGFLPGVAVFPLPGGSCGTGTLAAADFDGDGDVDIALSEEQACFGKLTSDLFVFENDGAGNLLPHVLQPLASGYFGLKAGDFDGDGRTDLLTTPVSFGQTFAVLPGQGDLGFGPAVVSLGATPPSRTFLGLFAAADFDGDGVLDVASLLEEQGSGTNLVGVFLGLGDGSFTSEPVTMTPASSTLELLRVGTDIDALDVDRDGDADVVVTNYASNDISVLLNDGTGALSSAGRLGANLRAQETVVADMDGDGLLDLVSLVGRPNIASGVVVVRATGESGQWIDVGSGLVGSTGQATLTGTGTLVSGSPTSIELDNALPGGSAFLVLGFSQIDASFKGGVLVPAPDFVFTRSISPSGENDLVAPWPAALPSGTELFWQYWIPDAGGVLDFAASNALKSILP